MIHSIDMVRTTAHTAFPDRGSPSTSHTRVRWQPYNTSCQSIPPHSPGPSELMPPLMLAYFVTPASSTGSISPSPGSLDWAHCGAFSKPNRTCHIHNIYHPPHQCESKPHNNDQQSKFALGLIGKSSESWLLFCSS